MDILNKYENSVNEPTANEQAQKIMKMREQARERAKRNYQKRKEAGTLKRYYTPLSKEARYKALPNEDEIKQLKYLKKPSTKTIKLTLEDFERLKLVVSSPLTTTTTEQTTPIF